VMAVRAEIPGLSWTSGFQVAAERAAPPAHRHDSASWTAGSAARSIDLCGHALRAEVAENGLMHRVRGRGVGAGHDLVLQLQLVAVVQPQHRGGPAEAAFTPPRALAPQHAVVGFEVEVDVAHTTRYRRIRRSPAATARGTFLRVVTRTGLAGTASSHMC